MIIKFEILNKTSILLTSESPFTVIAECSMNGKSWGELERVKSSKVVFNFTYPNISKYARIRIPKNKKIKVDIVTL